jgi:multidrug efflux pump subunit AcrB
MNTMIEWFARNHVAANLLMVGVIVAGLLAYPTIKQSVFPDFELDYVSVTVVYPGASPEDIEKSITIRVEEEIQEVDAIDELTSSANEGATNVLIELEDGADMGKILDEIESKVDSITTFPTEAEEPLVSEIAFSSPVLDVAVHGAVDERSLKRLGQQLRDDLANLPGVSKVELVGARPYEVAIEVSEAALQAFGLRFDDVVLAIRRSSLDLPGGSLRTDSGEILLRTDNQAYWGDEFSKIPLRVLEDGSRVTVGDVAKVVDGFEENIKITTFDGEPAVFVEVSRTGDQKALDIAAVTMAYVEQAQLSMPDGVSLTIWDNDAAYLDQRLNMMIWNAAGGFLLVVLLLSVFLRLRVAFWVAMGLPVSILGAIALMPVFGFSVNILTVFSFIMALGILVDDAIVTGENIHTHLQQDPRNPLEASIRGTHEVATPVTFGVLTTVAAFMPFMLIEGQARFLALGMGGVMCIALIFSLIESKLVLPSHLARAGTGKPPRTAISKRWAVFQERVAERLQDFIVNVYGPAVRACIEWRYLTLAVSVVVFAIAATSVSTGRVKQVMVPTMEADIMLATVKMPLGTPVSETRAAVAEMEASLEVLREQVDAEKLEDEEPFIEHVLTMVGTQIRMGPGAPPSATGQSHLAQMIVELTPSEERSVTTLELANRWRDLTAAIPGVEEMTFLGQFRNFGDPIEIELRGPDIDELESMAGDVSAALARYPGVKDIRDSHLLGKRELHVSVLPSAEALGLTVEDVARQMRQAFYGAEVQRIQRGRDEVKVMVRYPPDQRRALSDVASMRVRLPDGTAVPFSAVASAEISRGPASLLRRDRERRLSITADVDESLTNAVELGQEIESLVMPAIMADHPSVNWVFQGEQKERSESLRSIGRGFIIACFSIFILIAVPLRSYLQALVIMLTIPFGYVGAVLGHWLWDVELSFLSYIGIMACAGVVVNDSLVLVSFLNRMREEGHSARDAAALAGQRRFRAIMLTSVTTFAGLIPVLSSGSTQAQFVIPMAVSLGYGVIVATFFTLLLIPSAMIVVEDVKQGIVRLRDSLARRPLAILQPPQR